jgi:pimeloyl-ACP methyl ester carboxylesterase
VPLDYADPTGPTIDIAVTRIKHTSSDADYQGVMFGNPGGPGGAGRWTPYMSYWLPDADVASEYDWIGFDPRGVGASTPALSCDPGYTTWNRPSYVPTTQEAYDAWRAKASGYAADCGSSDAADLLAHVTTADTVADMESLRIALNREQINYYGFSYGTYLGEVYATLHPDRVRRMVWDGVIDPDPSRIWYPANLDQNVAFDGAVAHFWKWIAKHRSTYHLGRTPDAVEHAYYHLIKQLTEEPAGKIGPAEVTDVITGAAYYVYGWVDQAQALSDLIRHDDTTLMKNLFRGSIGDDNGYAMYLATECSEGDTWPAAWNTYEADARAQYPDHRFLTWSNTWYNAPCLDWPVGSVPAVQVDGSALTVPILLINETDDAATPYAGALAARAEFPTSSLIEGVNGSTHAGSLSGVQCTDMAIVRYLDTGAVPARDGGTGSDKQCDPVPPPRPGPSRTHAGPGPDRADAQIGRP